MSHISHRRCLWREIYCLSPCSYGAAGVEPSWFYSEWKCSSAFGWKYSGSHFNLFLGSVGAPQPGLVSTTSLQYWLSYECSSLCWFGEQLHRRWRPPSSSSMIKFYIYDSITLRNVTALNVKMNFYGDFYRRRGFVLFNYYPSVWWGQTDVVAFEREFDVPLTEVTLS